MNFIKAKKINKSGGFSLLELILAIAVFSLSSFALATLMIDSNISTKLSQERMNALLYTKEGIESAKQMRNISWDTLMSTSTTFDDKYLRQITVTPSSTATSVADVFVTVSWELTAGRRATTTLYTILTNWGGNN